MIKRQWHPPAVDHTASHPLSDFQRWVIEVMCEHKESIKLAQLIGQMECMADPGAFKAKQRLSEQTVQIANRLHGLQTLARDNGFAIFNPSARTTPVSAFPSGAFQS